MVASQQQGAWSEKVSPERFAFTAAVQGEVTDGTPARLALPAEVIAETKGNSSDLRLFDSQGAEVPYAIQEERTSAQSASQFAFNTLSYLPGEASETIVLEKPEKSGPFASVEIMTGARDFQKAVRIETSGDRKEWKPVAEDTVFDFSSRVDLRKTRIDLPATEARYLRLLIESGPDSGKDAPDIALRSEGLTLDVKGHAGHPFRIDRIFGHSGPSRPEAKTRDALPFVNPAGTADKNQTTVYALGRINLPIDSISFEVGDFYYHRAVEVWVADVDKEEAYRPASRGGIYMIPGMKEPATTLVCGLPQSRFVRVKVINGDNPPLKVAKIEVAWVRKNLYFFPQSGRSYALFFGGEEIPFPQYETRDILARSAKSLSAASEWKASSMSKNAKHVSSLSREEKARIGNGVLIAFVAVMIGGLSVWAVSLIKKLPQA
jgi:hypothetical protein